LKDGDSLYVADEPAQWVRRIVEILQTPSKGETIARRGQEVVRHAFSADRFVETVALSLAPLIAALS
jgi:hypothetical protein